MKMEEAVIGKKVTYTPFKGCDKRQLEHGVITGIAKDFIFVRYGDDVGSKATYPQDIDY